MAEWFLFLPQVRLDIPAIVERAHVAQSSGFDGIAFIDHLEAQGAVDQSIWEAMALWGDGELAQKPAPSHRIPLVLGGTGKKTMGLVRKHADWWNIPSHQLDRLPRLLPTAGSARVSLRQTPLPSLQTQ